MDMDTMTMIDVVAGANNISLLLFTQIVNIK